MYGEARDIRYSSLSDKWHAEVTLTVTDNKQAPVGWVSKALKKANDMELKEISIGTFGAYGGVAVKGKAYDVTEQEKFEYREKENLRRLIFNSPSGKIASALPNIVRDHAIENLDRDFVDKFVELRAEYEQDAVDLLMDNGFDPEKSGYGYMFEMRDKEQEA